jgi:Mrp family chromosome partitioning ATPase
VLRRRKWIILVAAFLVPAGALAVSFQQSPRYRGSAEVLLSRQNLAAALTNTQDATTYQQPERLVETQAQVARIPRVADETLRAAGVMGRSPQAFLESSSVSARPNADLLEFTVTDRSRRIAERLAGEYARQFTIYRRKLDTAAIRRARSEVRARIANLEKADDRGSPLYTRLVDKEQELATIEALQTSNAYVLRSGEQAERVQPRPVRNGVLGLALGLVLGVAFAFLWEALDTRVRSADEIAERLGLPLLARLAEPPKRIRRENRLVMLAQPAGVHAEAFRMLRTNFEFTNLECGARLVMVTSAVETEGKSTTVANLAVAFARAGKRVVLVDLDLRRPFLADLFDLDHHRPGITDVALAHAKLDDAIVSITLTENGGAGGAQGNGHRSVDGLLEVLAAGAIPPNAGEFVGTKAVGDIFKALAKRADVVLIDAPPLLHVGDALALSARVDAIVLVSRLSIVRRPMLSEVRRLLEASPAPALGFVLTGADLEDAYDYAGYYPYRGYAQADRIEELVT